MAEEQRRERDAGERLDRDERRDDRYTAAVVRLEERDVGAAEQNAGRDEGEPAAADPQACPRERRKPSAVRPGDAGSAGVASSPRERRRPSAARPGNAGSAGVASSPRERRRRSVFPPGDA